MTNTKTNNVKRQALVNVFWSGLDSIASSGITFLVGIVLARLLSPAEFGTIGIATIFINVLNSIVDCGFSSALIRKNNIQSVDYHTAFITNLCISVIMYFLCVVFSPLVGNFFDNPDLAPILKALSFIIIINALGLVQRTKLTKDVNFKALTTISLLASIISGFVGIVCAINGFGIWSLVWQQLSRQSLNTFLLWVFNKWKPKLEFSYNSFKELFGFGSKLLASRIVDTLCNELTTIVIGKTNTPATLGQYSRAKSFSSIFSSNLTNTIQRVSYPLLSKYQNNEEQLVAYYRKISRILMFTSSVLMVTLATSASELLPVLIGDKWNEAILYLQFVCFVDILYPLRAVNLNIIQVKGYSNYVLKLSIIKRCLEVIPICLCFISIKYMLIGFIATGIIGYLLNAYYASKVINYRIPTQIKDLVPSLISAAIIGCVVSFVGLLPFNTLIILVLKLLTSIICSFIICFTSSSQTCNDLRGIIKPLFSKIR